MNTDIHPKPKNIAILSYFSWIGWIAALILWNNKKEYRANEDIRHHINQAFCLHVLQILGTILTFFPYVGRIAGELVHLTVLILWGIALTNAVKRNWKPLPIISEWEILKSTYYETLYH